MNTPPTKARWENHYLDFTLFSIVNNFKSQRHQNTNVPFCKVDSIDVERIVISLNHKAVDNHVALNTENFEMLFDNSIENLPGAEKRLVQFVDHLPISSKLAIK
jgi:tRNA(Ile)-lysidine synthase TilS/MesJ